MTALDRLVDCLRTALTRPMVFSIILFSGCASTTSPAIDSTQRETAGTAVVQTVFAEVVEVVDGDTLLVSFPATVSSHDDEIVRLLGIDTPETVDPTRPVQCFGPEASAELQRLLPVGSAIWLERDVEARDRFGRLLAYAHRGSDDLFINEALVAGGFADVSIFEPNSAYRSTLIRAVTSAKTSARGLWGSCGGPDVPLDPGTEGG